MSMRIKAREKNLLLTCRSVNKVEQIKTFKNELRDTTKRKNYSKYQIDERETFDIDSRKRSKNIRKSHSEKQMKIPVKESMTIKESTKDGPVSINDSNEDNYKNEHNVNTQTQNYSIKHTADKRSSHLNEYHDTAILSKESNQPSSGPDKKGDSTNKVIFVSLNFVDKPDKSDKTIKATNQTKLRRLWKNLQHISSYHRKRKIGRLRKYCYWKTISSITKCNGKYERNRNDPENEKISPRQNKTKETVRIHWEKTKNKKTGRIFESKSHTTNNWKKEHDANKETSNQIIVESDRELLDFSYQKGPPDFNKLTPEDDVSKIDEKYLKYILLITKKEGLNTLKNNENQENVNKGEDKDDENVPKGKKSVNILKVKTSLNRLKSKQIPLNTTKDNNQSKDELPQNKKELSVDKIKSEFKPLRESLISDQRTQQRKKIIVLKLSSTKQSDCSRKSRINQVKKQSGPANSREDKYNSRDSNPKNPISKKKEIIVTTPHREEMSKFEFIEIWRRNSRKESQGSLSSHSSIERPNNREKSDEDSSDCEYLGIRSYQALKKIVEQEVLKIFKSYKQKKVENDKNKAEPKTNENTKPPVPLGEKSGTITVNKAQLENKPQPAHKQNTVTKDDGNDVKSDRVTQTKINLPPQKDKLPLQDQNFKTQDNEPEKLRVTIRKSSKELNRKLKILSEQENKDIKIPSEILKNWTIMHRLEKAFLALGTPNFHSKSLLLTKKRAIGGKVTNRHDEKDGVAKIKITAGGGYAADENKTYKPRVNSSTIKMPQMKRDIKYLGRLETEQEVKRSKTEKETLKGIKKKDDSNVQDLLRKSIQAPTTKKSTKSCNTKKPEEISLSKDHKAQVKQRFKPETLSQVPHRIFENTDTKSKHRLERPMETQGVSAKPTLTSVRPVPNCEDDSNDDDDLDCKIGFSNDPDESSLLGCTFVNEIDNDFAEEVKHFDSQIEKLLDLKSSRNLLFEGHDQNKIEDENLERKKTFAVFPKADTTNIKLKKTRSCHKLEINSKCSCSTISQKNKIDYWDPFEHNNKKSTYEQYSRSNISRKDQNCPSKAELLLKTSNNSSLKHDDYVSVKTSIYSNEDVMLINPSEVQLNREKMPAENIPQKFIFPRKEVNPNERVVKERFILSLGQNLKKTQREPSSERIKSIPRTKDCKKSNCKTTSDVFHTKGSRTNYSNMSAINADTNDVAESSIGSDYQDHQTQKPIIILNRLCPAPPTQNISTTTFTAVPLSKELPSSITKTVKIQPNWESDIRQYRAIVTDIIDQYKRTKGFLKQNEALLDPLADTKFIKVQGKAPLSSNLRFLDIDEYRRKIISEYRDLSIFEYKSKIQETSNSEEVKTERGLAVVKEVTPEMDYDIKDFQPNIKKVLNSQIYVDQNHFYKLKCLRVKSVDQNPSLQEVMLSTSKLGTQQIKPNDPRKSAHTPKSNVCLPNSKVYSVLFHTPNHSKVEVDSDFTFDDFMSLSELEDTESDVIDYH